jgi:hypothetical protein
MGELVTGGDANALHGTLDSGVRSMDEGRRGKVLAALELLGRLYEELRKNPPQNETRSSSTASPQPERPDDAWRFGSQDRPWRHLGRSCSAVW